MRLISAYRDFILERLHFFWSDSELKRPKLRNDFSAGAPASNHKKTLCGWASALPPAFRPARNFTSAGSAGDLVAGPHTNRVFGKVVTEWLYYLVITYLSGPRPLT
jgi:hypothetical protein